VQKNKYAIHGFPRGEAENHQQDLEKKYWGKGGVGRMERRREKNSREERRRPERGGPFGLFNPKKVGGGEVFKGRPSCETEFIRRLGLVICTE
jgi:hypothetical protein